jgi:hypothetical protein
MKRIDPQTLQFDSGRTLRPIAGVIGIDPELRVRDGADIHGYPFSSKPPTQQERQDLAAYMIDLWRRFGDIREKP